MIAAAANFRQRGASDTSNAGPGLRKRLSRPPYPEPMIALLRPALLLLNATLIAWLGYYVLKLPGDPLGYALLCFLPANLLFLLLVPIRQAPGLK